MEEIVKRKRGNPSFVKGKSGNPVGRPKITAEQLDLIAACKDRTPRALQVIVDLMENSKNCGVRLSAAQAIIERGYGKPVQPVDAHIEGSLELSPVRPKLTRDEWLASLAK